MRQCVPWDVSPSILRDSVVQAATVHQRCDSLSSDQLGVRLENATRHFTRGNATTTINRQIIYWLHVSRFQNRRASDQSKTQRQHETRRVDDMCAQSTWRRPAASGKGKEEWMWFTQKEIITLSELPVPLEHSRRSKLGASTGHPQGIHQFQQLGDKA